MIRIIEVITPSNQTIFIEKRSAGPYVAYSTMEDACFGIASPSLMYWYSEQQLEEMYLRGIEKYRAGLSGLIDDAPASVSEFDGNDPVFYYVIDGIGGVRMEANGLEIADGSTYEEAAKELFELSSAKMKMLQGKSYRIITKEQYQNEYGEDEEAG